MSQLPSGQTRGPMGALGRGRTLDYSSEVGEVTLSQFFNAVYAWMAAGLALTATVAWVVANDPKLMAPILNPVGLIVLFIAQIALVSVVGSAVNRIGAGAATALFLIYAALNGVTLSVLFLIYTKASLAGTFFVTAGTFGAMSVYGMVTKRDLTRLGSLLFMALIGLILASIVNIFWSNPILYWAISYAGVLIFVGLTAYDTQALKQIAAQTSNDSKMSARMAIVGSLKLYLDFINLFIMLLRIMGDRRR